MREEPMRLRLIITVLGLAVFVVSPAFPQSSGTTAAVGTPTTYHAVSNRNVYPKPALPALGPAGWRFADPAFGSRLLRVTDGNTDTRPGFAGSSFSTPSAAHQLAWNATSDRFYVRSLSDFPPLTDPVVTAGATVIRAAHIQELRQAVVTLEGS